MERKKLIDNTFYDTLEAKWYEADDHPIALLRAENNARTPWICEKIRNQLSQTCHILDIGCGGGFLTNALAKEGHVVTGIDLSPKSLEVARKRDDTESVHYLEADAYHLPFPDNAFDVVSAMDFLEHVDKPGQVVQEASRVLKKGGLFFFHTFNRNWVSWLVVIKGVEWFVKNTPCHMHVYSLLVKPSELEKYCTYAKMQTIEMKGLMPDFRQKAFWKMLATKKVPANFSFRQTSLLTCGYMGFARKQA